MKYSQAHRSFLTANLHVYHQEQGHKLFSESQQKLVCLVLVFTANQISMT